MHTSADKTASHSSQLHHQQLTQQPSFLQRREDTPFFGQKQSQPFFGPAFVQPKLTVGAPDDKYEKEADAVADRVMTMPETPVAPTTMRKEDEIQRMEEEGDEEVQAKFMPGATIQRMGDDEDETVQAKLMPGNFIQRSEDEGADEIQTMPESGPAIQREEAEATEEDIVQTKPEDGLVSRMEEDKEEKVQAKTEGSGPHIQRRKESGEAEACTCCSPMPTPVFLQRKCAACDQDDKLQRKTTTDYNNIHIQRSGRGPPTVTPPFESSLQSSKGKGSSLPDNARSSLENRFGADFSGVRVHTDSNAVQMNREINAQAFTHGNDIYFNAGKYNPHTSSGGHLLAHELTHTIQQGASKTVRAKHNAFLPRPPTAVPAIQTKPGKVDNSSEPRSELKKAVAYAKGEVGKVNAAKMGTDGYRVGWERLVDYFSTAMGEDKIIHENEKYRPGGLPVTFIKSKKEVEALKPADTGGHAVKMVPGKENRIYRDGMPSWCGIFVFWALNKGGVPMQRWILGQQAFPLGSAYPKNYTPRPGDVAYRSAFSHYAIVEKSSGTGANATVTTINGNTAGEDNLGGQIQDKEHKAGNWTGFFNPLFGKEDKMPEETVVTDAELARIISGESGGAALVVSKPEPVKVVTETKKLFGGKKNKEEPETEKPVAKTVGKAEKGKEGEPEKPAEEPREIPKAPTKPQDDPAFQAVKGKTKTAAATQQVHGVPETEAEAAQEAAVAPANDISSKAQANQVEKMSAQQKGKFNAQVFKEKLKEKIKKAVPESEDEAKKFKDDNKLEDVKEELEDDVKAEKKDASGAIETATTEAPDPSGIEAKKVVPMGKTDAGAKPLIPDAKKAAPKPKTEQEISMESDAQELDTEMEKNEVSEDQLANSNEPEFTGALDSKKEAQASARNAPTEYRAEEKPDLKKAENGAAAMVDGKMGEMFGERGKLLGEVDGAKTDTKTKDEAKRKEVSDKLQGFYTTTKTNVETILGALDKSVSDQFDAAAKQANEDFEKNVSKRLDDYYGYFTFDDAIVEFVGGLPKEVDDIFQDEKRKFIEKMDIVIDAIAKEVETKLNEAITEIDKGRKDVEDYVSKLEPALQEYGKTAAGDILSKFDDLEQQVEAKQEELTDKLAKKYSENVDKLQEKFDKIKSDKQGFLGKALGALAAVIKTIKQLANMLFDVLAKVAHVVGKIIKDPIGFLGNLVKAIGMGLNNFKDNILVHLKKGFFEWLLGNMPPGIVFPKEWDMKGIFTFVMSIIGLTWSNIRARAVLKLGEPVVKALETTFEIFNIIIKEGLPGLWKFIMDKVGDLKVMVIEAIMSFLAESVIKAGVMWIIGLLNPAGAFIKACKLIYDIVMFFVERGRQILEFVNTVISSISLIVAGNLVPAAKMVENSLAKLIPIAIGFLASLLGLTGISEKVQKIIKAVQTPINKAIDWVLDKAISFAKKLGLDKVVKKVKGGVQKGKDWAKKKTDDVKKWGKKKMDNLKGKKDHKVSPEDEKRHKQYAAEVIAELSEKPEKQTSFKDFTKGLKKKAASLEKTYNKKLKKPVKMKISLTDFNEKNVSFKGKVHIGPNDTDVEQSIAIVSQTSVIYVAEVGLRDKNGQVIKSARLKDEQEKLVKAIREALKASREDQTDESIKGNIALAVIQISGLSTKKQKMGNVEGLIGGSEVFKIEIGTKDIPHVFTSALGGSQRTTYTTVTGNYALIKDGKRSLQVTTPKQVKIVGLPEGASVELKTQLEESIMIEPDALTLAKDHGLIVEGLNDSAGEDKEKLKSDITSDAFYQAYKHSEQAVYQAFKASDAKIAQQVESFQLAEIHDALLNIYTERDMCKQCASSGNKLIKELNTAAPLTYQAIAKIGNQNKKMRIIATSTVFFSNRARNYGEAIRDTENKIARLTKLIAGDDSAIVKINELITKYNDRLGGSGLTPEQVTRNTENRDKKIAELTKRQQQRSDRAAEILKHESNLEILRAARPNIEHEVLPEVGDNPEFKPKEVELKE